MTEYTRTGEDVEFYEAIGRGITLWAEIEYEMSILYSFCLGDKTGVALDAFYSNQTFYAKLKVLNAAVKSYFRFKEDPASLEHWTNLYNRLDKQSDERNKLAHYQVIEFNPFETNRGNYYLCRPYLPVRHTAEELKEFEQDGLSASDIYRNYGKHHKLYKDLRDFNIANDALLGWELHQQFRALPEGPLPSPPRQVARKKKKTSSKPRK